MKTSMTHETNINKMLSNFREDLYFGEDIEAFINKSDAFISFFHDLSQIPCENLNIMEEAKNVEEIIQKIKDSVWVNTSKKLTNFYSTTKALAKFATQNHLEIIEDVTEMIGDYYNNVCAYGLYKDGEDISSLIQTDDYIDLMDKLGVIYALTYDKLEELEKNVEEKEIDDREFE